MAAEHWALLRMLIVTIVLGVALIRVFCPRGQISLAAMIGLSFPLGMGVIGLTCQFLGWVDVELHINNIMIALGVVLALLLIGCLARWKLECQSSSYDHQKFPDKSESFSSWSGWQKLIFVVLGLYVIYEFYFIVGVAFVLPIGVYDALVITALKSKVFFYDAAIHALKFLPLPSYPLMVPFEMFWVALNLGRWDDTLVNVIFPLTYLSFTIFQYFFMRARFGILWALACCALTVSSALYNYHAAITYQDFTLMVFNVAAQMLMVMCYRRRDIVLLPLASLCAGMGVFVKLEGTVYLIINAVMCLYLLKSMPWFSLIKRVRAFFIFLGPGIAIYIFHALFVASQGFAQAEGRYVFKSNLHLMERLGTLISNYAHSFFLCNNWTMIWAILIVGLFASGRQLFKDFEARFYGLIITLTIGMFLAVDILTSNYISHYSVLARVVLHFYPIVPIFIVLIHAQLLVGKRK